MRSESHRAKYSFLRFIFEHFIFTNVIEGCDDYGGGAGWGYDWRECEDRRGVLCWINRKRAWTREGILMAAVSLFTSLCTSSALMDPYITLYIDGLAFMLASHDPVGSSFIVEIRQIQIEVNCSR